MRQDLPRARRESKSIIWREWARRSLQVTKTTNATFLIGAILLHFNIILEGEGSPNIITVHEKLLNNY
jgi:hypothetical protein